MSNNFIEIRMGGGTLNLEILSGGGGGGGGAQAVSDIQVEGGVKTQCLPSLGCGFFLE